MANSPEEAEFDWVRRVFFPRWKAGAEWKLLVQQRTDYGLELGFCESELRCILVSPSLRSNHLAFRLTLVHEVCHAVTSAAHGKKWSRRMLSAAKVAETIGETRLAVDLNKEVESYEKPWRVNAATVYGEIEDAILNGANPQAAIRGVAGSIGVTIEELEKQYSRARKVAADYVTSLRTWPHI